MNLYGYQENNEIPYFPIQAKGIFYIIIFLILMLLGSSHLVYIYLNQLLKKMNVFSIQ